MSDTTRSVIEWPSVVALRLDVADQVARVASLRRCEVGWTVEETQRQVRAAAMDAADNIAQAVLDAAELSLDVWAATR
ncbi:MAG: hypothetical protein WB765_00805 [Acidimicrobiales bacterium]